MARTRAITGLMLMLLFAAAATDAAAQSQPPAVFGLAGALVQKADYDNARSGTTIGPTIGFQVRTGRLRATAFSFELMGQPNPARQKRLEYEDSFAPFYAMGGAEIGRRTYVRLSAGVTTVTSAGPMAGLAIGFERPTGASLLSGAEFVIRVGGAAGEIGAMAGVQLRLGAGVRR
jgi:hypothetical protein